MCSRVLSCPLPRRSCSYPGSQDTSRSVTLALSPLSVFCNLPLGSGAIRFTQQCCSKQAWKSFRASISFLLFFCEVREPSLNLLALMNLSQREKGERFPTTPVNSPMLGALELIWQKEKARRDLLLGGLPGCLALHPSPSPDNSIQLTRQETGVLGRPAAKKATFPSGEKTRLGWPPSPPP